LFSPLRRSIAVCDGALQESSMPIWTFVRHGESLANLEGWLAGQHDTPLTERGRAQAIAAREALPRPLPPRAFCSDLQRAHHTAQLLLEHEDLPLVVTPRLRERALGAWRRRAVHELTEPRQRMGSWRGRPPGGESLLAVALRVAAWATRVDDSPRDTLIVAHGALMRAVVAAIDRVPRDRLGLERPRNGEVISRKLQVGDWAKLLDELREEAASHDPR